jgi:heme/copper-type cytochrome/quinol oxidase subunit 3
MSEVARGRRQALPNGLWGVALLVATEAALFGTLLASYFYLRFTVTTWPPAGIDPPDVVLPLALTAALVTTAAPLFLAARAARAGDVGRARAMIALALLVQGAYIAVQVILFKRDLGDFSPSETAYGSIYFTMLATHHAHVVAGMLLEVGILAKLIGGLTSYRVVGVRAVALYWYFVAAIGIFVVLTQVSPSL